MHAKIQLFFCAYVYFEFIRMSSSLTHSLTQWMKLDIFTFGVPNELHLFPLSFDWIILFLRRRSSFVVRWRWIYFSFHMSSNNLSHSHAMHAQTFILFACEDTIMTTRITTSAGVYNRCELWRQKERKDKKNKRGEKYVIFPGVENRICKFGASILAASGSLLDVHTIQL